MPLADIHFTHRHSFTVQLCCGRPYHSHWSPHVSDLAQNEAILLWIVMTPRAKTHHELSVSSPHHRTFSSIDGVLYGFLCNIWYSTHTVTWCKMMIMNEDDHSAVDCWAMLTKVRELLDIMLTTLNQNRQPLAEQHSSRDSIGDLERDTTTKSKRLLPWSPYAQHSSYMTL